MHEHEAPGVRLHRRTALTGGLALPALLSLARIGNSRRTAAGEVEDFLASWTERAQELAAAEDPREDAHLYELCSHLALLDPGSFPSRKLDAFKKNGMTTGPIQAGETFLVLEIELEPGAVIQAHNHVGWSFLSLGVSGEATVQHFEPVGEDTPDPGKELDVEFTLREVSSAVLTRGRTSTLTRTRSNIHHFVAGEKGAKIIDFGVHFPDPGGGFESFSVLDFDPSPLDPARRTHTGRWIGNIYAK